MRAESGSLSIKFPTLIAIKNYKGRQRQDMNKVEKVIEQNSSTEGDTSKLDDLLKD